MNGVDNTVASQIDRYLAGVRAALADLPPETRDDLIDDLPAHFTELLDEHAGGLEERLGSPAAYAAELRAAAGLGPVPGRHGRNADELAAAARQLADLSRAADRSVGAFLGYERSTDFIRLLRPAWWVARGALVALVLLEAGPVDGGIRSPLGLLVVLFLAGVSVRVGSLTKRVPPPVRPVIVGASVLLVVLAWANLPYWGNGSDTVSYSPDRWDQVTDVYPYDQNGNPLQNVTLYDQNGQPLQFGDYGRCATADESDAPRYPLCKGPRAGATPTPSPSADVSITPSPSQSSGR
jgi:hypothetical protein